MKYDKDIKKEKDKGKSESGKEDDKKSKKESIKEEKTKKEKEKKKDGEKEDSKKVIFPKVKLKFKVIIGSGKMVQSLFYQRPTFSLLTHVEAHNLLTLVPRTASRLLKTLRVHDADVNSGKTSIHTRK